MKIKVREKTIYEAMQFTGDNAKQIGQFVKAYVSVNADGNVGFFKDPYYGDRWLMIGDWVIMNGNFLHAIRKHEDFVKHFIKVVNKKP